MLTLSETYEVITEESTQHGEAEENGFNFQEEKYSFRDLVDYLKAEYYNAEPSEMPSKNPRCITSYGDMDFVTGDYTNKSLHPAQDKTTQKYWPKALRAAGIIK